MNRRTFVTQAGTFLAGAVPLVQTERAAGDAPVPPAAIHRVQADGMSLNCVYLSQSPPVFRSRPKCIQGHSGRPQTENRGNSITLVRSNPVSSRYAYSTVA